MVHFENDVPVQIEDRCVNAERIPTILDSDYTKPRRMPFSRLSHR